MQFLIDTATDSPAELYRVGKYLTDTYATSPASDVARDANPHAIPSRGMDTPMTVNLEEFLKPEKGVVPPPPPAALTVEDVVSETDPDVEIDDAGNVTAVTTTVELPAAPPPPPAVPAPPGPAVAAELDAAGLPWDGRIHASNRAKTIKGEWKYKRGVDKNLVAACEAQNKPGNAPSTATVPATVVSALAASVSTPPPPSAVAPPPAAPSAVTSSAVPSTGVAPTAIDFRGLMVKIQTASAAGKLTPAQVNAALAGVGLQPQDMAQLINNAPLIASVNAAIDSCLPTP